MVIYMKFNFLILLFSILLARCGGSSSGNSGGSGGGNTESIKFVAVGQQGTIITSTDGTTWETQTSGTSTELFDVKYINNKIYAVGRNGLSLVLLTVNLGKVFQRNKCPPHWHFLWEWSIRYCWRKRISRWKLNYINFIRYQFLEQNYN